MGSYISPFFRRINCKTYGKRNTGKHMYIGQIVSNVIFYLRASVASGIRLAIRLSGIDIFFHSRIFSRRANISRNKSRTCPSYYF